MTDLEYFKTLFDREQIRKIELNNEVNIPIGIITLMSGLIMFTLKESDQNYNCFIMVLTVITGILICASLFFLAKSYNNLFMGFKYDNLPNTQELYKHKLELKEYNKKVKKKERETFKQYLIRTYAKMNSKNMKINKSRLDALYYAKTLLFTAIIFVILLLTTIIIISTKTL